MADRIKLALWNLRSAVDEAMGDSDLLVDDDTVLFAAMQEASHALGDYSPAVRDAPNTVDRTKGDEKP